MPIEPRKYQGEAIDALFDYWMASTSITGGNALIDLATGTGKSLVMALIIMRLLRDFPDMRIAVVTHVQELIEQNFEELKGLWPEAPAGIYSAGLKRADYKAQVIFCGIQTVWNKVDIIGDIDLVLVDECHLIPPDAATRYGKFLEAVRKRVPDAKIVGMTATPYRLDSGRLDEGEGRMFDNVVFTYSVAEGVEDGYLTPLKAPTTEVEYIPEKAFKKNKEGDFQEKAQREWMATDTATTVTEKAVAEIVARGRAGGYRSWVCFCSGADHAYQTRDLIREYGVTCETIMGDTPRGERRDILAAYKNYEIQCVTNNGVLTTGFNHRGVDLIAFMRLTMATSLYLQMAGRGTRPLYRKGFNEHDPRNTAEDRRRAIAEGPKPHTLILDFARLVDTHGPVDSVTVKGPPGSGDGEAPSKRCPVDIEDKPRPDENGHVKDPQKGCGEKVHASARKCKECGYHFPLNEEGPKIEETAAQGPVMTATPPEWRNVRHVDFKYHAGKDGKPPTVKVVYYAGGSQIFDWFMPEHGRGKSQWMVNKGDNYWKRHGGEEPPPRSVEEWLSRRHELAKTTAILVKPSKTKGYWDVKDYHTEDDERRHDEAMGFSLAKEMSDTIPF